MMKRMTLKQYAVKHKLSLFNVVKMVKNGQLQSETVEENGKEVTYVLPNEAKGTQTSADSKQTEPALSDDEMKKLLLSLQDEVSRLRHEVDTLKMGMGLK